MVGKLIHLLYQQDLVRGGITLMCPHATIEGACEHLDDLRNYWKAKGKILHEDYSHVCVGDLTGEPIWYFFISTRTIEK